MRLRRNNKEFPPLNVINEKKTPYEIKGVLRHYTFRSYTNFGK